MKVLVSRMYVRGVPRSQDEVTADVGIRGELHVEQLYDETEERSRLIARLAPPLPEDRELLPLLADAALQWMSVQGFVLSGAETVEGTQYAPAWWCRVC